MTEPRVPEPSTFVDAGAPPAPRHASLAAPEASVKSTLSKPESGPATGGRGVASPRNRGGRPTRDQAARRLVAKELQANRDLLPQMIERMRQLVLTGGPSVSVQAEQSLARLEARAERELARTEKSTPTGMTPEKTEFLECVKSYLHYLDALDPEHRSRLITARTDLPDPPGSERTPTFLEVVAELDARREAILAHRAEVDALATELEEKERRVRAAQQYLERVEIRPLGEPSA